MSPGGGQMNVEGHAKAFFSLCLYQRQTQEDKKVAHDSMCDADVARRDRIIPNKSESFKAIFFYLFPSQRFKENVTNESVKKTISLFMVRCGQWKTE